MNDVNKNLCLLEIDWNRMLNLFFYHYVNSKNKHMIFIAVTNFAKEIKECFYL